MESEQARFLLDEVFLPGLRNEHSITRGIIEAIPPEQGDYRPDEISKTAFELAWHLTSVEMVFLSAVVAGEFAKAEPRPDGVVNSADLSLWYASNFEAHLRKVAELTGEQLTKVIDFRGLFQLPAVMYLNFTMNHSIHHRGQLSMYLRPMGAKVPVIYGESYDSAAARKAG